jgi:hypothetical protein
MIATATMLALLAAGAAAAEPSTRVDEGKVEAIEMIRAPDDGPLNAGTVVGGIAGGVIGHQIGSGRGKRGGDDRGHDRRRGGRQRDPQEACARPRATGSSCGSMTAARWSSRTRMTRTLRVGDRVRVEGNRIQRI